MESIKVSSHDQIPLVMSAKDVQALGLSRSMTCNLLNRADFPVIAIGGRKFVYRDRFFEWLNQQAEGLK